MVRLPADRLDHRRGRDQIGTLPVLEPLRRQADVLLQPPHQRQCRHPHQYLLYPVGGLGAELDDNRRETGGTADHAVEKQYTRTRLPVGTAQLLHQGHQFRDGRTARDPLPDERQPPDRPRRRHPPMAHRPLERQRMGLQQDHHLDALLRQRRLLDRPATTYGPSSHRPTQAPSTGARAARWSCGAAATRAKRGNASVR